MSARRCCTALHHAQALPRTLTRTQQRRTFALTSTTHNTPKQHFGKTPSRPGSDYTLKSAPQEQPDPSSADAIKQFASKLRQSSAVGAAATEPYAAYGTTEKMYRACAAAGEYTLSASAAAAPGAAAAGAGEATAENDKAMLPPLKTEAGEDVCFPLSAETWHATYGLPPTFSTWAQLTFLHLHVLQLRIRQFPAGHSRAWTQQLLDHFFYGAEEKMASVHKLEMRGVRAKYLKDLFEQWRGAEISYDEGIVKGDAVLAAAVWRNLFQGREDTDVVKVAEVVGWMRRAARGLAGLSDAEFASGRWKFGVPWEGREVQVESEGIKRGVDD